MGHMIAFKRPDGGETAGFLAEAGKGRPGIVVIQEWWGLNDQICGVADRFARAGYNALAPDLYEGRVDQEPDEANHLMDGLDFPGATHQDIRGAVRHLKGIGGKVGVMGFCMGGALTVAAAVHVPEADAAVCFYGIPPKEFADPAKIASPLPGPLRQPGRLVHAGRGQRAGDGLKEVGAAHEVFRYDAQHAFFNERERRLRRSQRPQLLGAHGGLPQEASLSDRR